MTIRVSGKSISIGEWGERPDSLWRLRIPLTIGNAPGRDAAANDAADAAKWRALIGSDRITCMGSAHLLDPGDGYAHATFNFWTGSAARAVFGETDSQDKNGRQQLDLYMAKALCNAPAPEPLVFNAYSDDPKQVLAVMALQSDRYRDEPDFRDAVDNVLYQCGVRPRDYVALKNPKQGK